MLQRMRITAAPVSTSEKRCVCVSNLGVYILNTGSCTVKKKARGVLGLSGVTAQGVLWQHTRVLSWHLGVLADYVRVLGATPSKGGVLGRFKGVLS